jgi:hypothetical protein
MSLLIAYAQGADKINAARCRRYFGENVAIPTVDVSLPCYSLTAELLRDSLQGHVPTNISMEPEVMTIDGVDTPLTFTNVQRLLRYSPHREEVWLRNITQRPENLPLMAKLFSSRVGTAKTGMISKPLEFLHDYAARLKLPDIPAAQWMKCRVVSLSPEECINVIVAELCSVFSINMTRGEYRGYIAYTVGETGRLCVLDIFERAGKSPEIPFTLPCGQVIIISASYSETWGYDEVITIFHEFGHVFQFAYGTTDVSEPDYGEIPGVAFENFAWRVWGKLGVEPPDFSREVAISRQVAIAIFDQLVHRGEEPRAAQTVAFSHWLRGSDTGHFWTSFEHFLGSYWGRYYSYPLAYAVAEVIFPAIIQRPRDFLTMLAKIGVIPAARALREFEEKTSQIIK